MLNRLPDPFGLLITTAMMLTTTPLVAPAQQDGSRVTQIIIDRDGNISQPNRNQRRTRPRHRDWSLNFETVKQHFVLVNTALGAGSGFIVKMGDKVYIVTNQHVIAGASKLGFSTLDGQTL